jgi:predicted DNA binding protein
MPVAARQEVALGYFNTGTFVDVDDLSAIMGISCG